MTQSKISIGLLAPSIESRDLIRSLVDATGLASVDVESEQYCTSPSDRAARRFVETRPEIILIDLQDPQSGLISVSALQAALPDARVFVVSDKNEPQLIIEAMRAGAREFLPKPIPPRSLSQALGRFIAEKQRQPGARGEGKIYSFLTAKEGSGATSVAINTAGSLTSQPKSRVALLDLNSPVGDVATYLNLSPQFTISDALAAASRLDGVLLESYMSQAHGLYVLPGPRETGPGPLPRLDALAKLLEVVAATFTHTMIDLPPTFLPKEHLEVLAEMSSVVVVVLTPELPSISRTGRLIRHLSMCGVSDKLQLVINRSRRTDEFTDGEIEKVLHHPIYHKIPNNYKDSVTAIISGKPLVRTNNSELVRSYDELAHLLAGIARPKKRRWLSGFGSRS